MIEQILSNNNKKNTKKFKTKARRATEIGKSEEAFG
jgi:hypothetical protein